MSVYEVGCALLWSGTEWNSVAGPCEHDNKPRGFITGKTFLDRQRDFHLPKNE
jgi:hypothetical protein